MSGALRSSQRGFRHVGPPAGAAPLPALGRPAEGLGLWAGSAVLLLRGIGKLRVEPFLEDSFSLESGAPFCLEKGWQCRRSMSGSFR